MMAIEHNRHSIGGSNYHFQFTPKYRKAVFRVGRVRNMIKALLEYKAHKLGVQIEAIEFGPDHVHLFVTNCRKYSVSKLVNHLKGYSSYKVRRALPRDIAAFLWGGSFWSDGYFYESIGRVTTETVKFYIERQQRKHWTLAEAPEITLKETSTNQRTLESFCT